MPKYVLVEEEVEIPPEVTLTLEGKKVTVKGDKGTNVNDFSHAKALDMEMKDDKVRIYASFPKNQTISVIKTIKNLIINMIKGVTQGYTYKMKIVYSHFPMSVDPPKGKDNRIVVKTFLGEKAPRVSTTTGDVKVTATKEDVIVTGCNNQDVGQTCANLTSVCRIRDKDKRIFQDGIYVYEKLLGDEIFWKIK